MSTVAAIASIVAAITGIAALSLAASERKRRRLTEIIDLVTDIKAAMDWGQEQRFAGTSCKDGFGRASVGSPYRKRANSLRHHFGQRRHFRNSRRTRSSRRGRS